MNQSLYKPFYDEKITPANKKYSVYINGNKNNKKLIHFGDRRYEHYYDKIGHWSSLNHLDKNRRKKYRARASGIKDKKGGATYTNRDSPNYWSYNYLW